VSLEEFTSGDQSSEFEIMAYSGKDFSWKSKKEKPKKKKTVPIGQSLLSLYFNSEDNYYS
jgi:hypothetical protein